MNKLYNIYNKSGRRGCIAAPSEERAIDLAFAANYARKRENIKAVEVEEAIRFNGYGQEFKDWDKVVNGPEGVVSLSVKVHTVRELIEELKAKKDGTWKPGEPASWKLTPFSKKIIEKADKVSVKVTV